MTLAATHSFPWGLELIGLVGAALGLSVQRKIWRLDYVLPNWQRDSLYGQGLFAAGLPAMLTWTSMFIDGALVSLSVSHHSVAGIILLVLVIAISLMVIVFFFLTAFAFLAFERLPSRLVPPCLRK